MKEIKQTGKQEIKNGKAKTRLNLKTLIHNNQKYLFLDKKILNLIKNLSFFY